jgi:hypothetical protein
VPSLSLMTGETLGLASGPGGGGTTVSFSSWRRRLGHQGKAYANFWGWGQVLRCRCWLQPWACPSGAQCTAWRRIVDSVFSGSLGSYLLLFLMSVGMLVRVDLESRLSRVVSCLVPDAVW